MTAVKVRERDDLLTVMRQARERLGLTHLEMDERVGLGSGHYGKVERMGAGWGKEAFRMTSTVVNILDALELELVIAPKGEIASEAVPRDVRLPPSNVLQFRPAQPMSAQPMSASPGLVDLWLIEARERQKKAQKKPRRALRQAGLSVGGATC